MANETTAPEKEQADEVQLISVDEMKAQIKPLSKNAFVAFWQKIYRAWLGVWYGFSDKHPKLSSWIYKIVFFFVFSIGVTIWQFLIFLFLPYAFQGLEAAFGWPGVQVGDLTMLNPIGTAVGGKWAEWETVPACFNIFGDATGLGNWIAFEIAVFTAQCINFPLQRNITFKSKGNPVVQAIWYFIGWVCISFVTGAIWGIIEPVLRSWGWFYVIEEIDGVEYLVQNGALYTVATLLKTFITGGVSMIIFFFIFLVIFPDLNKVAAGKKKKYEKLYNNGGTDEQVAKAKLEYDIADEKARLDTAEKDMNKAIAQASAMAVAYDSRVKRLNKMKEKGAEGEKIEALEKGIAEAHVKASKAYYAKVEAIANNDKVKAEVAAQREARGEAA